MKAMVLAAGLGTRLKEFTQTKPKALVEVEGKPLLSYIIDKLTSSGFDEIVINVHHFADQIVEYVNNSKFNARIYISDESNQLLNTGGGIVKAKVFLDGDEPFLVHNVDILSDIDLVNLMDFHKKSDSLATLAVGQRNSSRMFLFDEKMQLTGWKNLLTGKEIIPDNTKTDLRDFAFAGIHIISPFIFNLIQTKGAFSIVDAYLSLCSKHSILGYDTTSNFVLDIGKVQNLEEASRFVLRNQTAG